MQWAGGEGDADLQWFYHYMERSDAVIYSVLQRRRAALLAADWDSLLAVYGVPSLFLVGPPNVPVTKEAEFLEVAERIVADDRGYLPIPVAFFLIFKSAKGRIRALVSI